MRPECPQVSEAQGQRLGERLRPPDPAGFFHSSGSLVPRAKLPISLLRPLFWETYPQLHDCEQAILITVCGRGVRVGGEALGVGRLV